MTSARAILQVVTGDSIADYMINLGACTDCTIAHEVDPFAGWCEACSTSPEPDERGLVYATPRVVDQLHRQRGRCLSCGDQPVRAKSDIPLPICHQCARHVRYLAAVWA